MLLEFLLFVAPGGAIMFVLMRFIKRNALVSVARTETARAEARMEAAQAASEVAQETAREALGQVTDALTVARTIGIVDAKVDFIVSAIRGVTDARTAGRHSGLPNRNATPAINGGNDGVLL